MTMRLAAIWVVVTAAWGAGCVRLIAPAQQPDVASLSNGGACSGDSVCVSGHCVDGVCCNRACQEVETCSLPSARGTCTRRELGTPCASHSQCPLNLCVDGVCCLEACEGACQHCNAPGQLGQCVPAASNTDPRNACPGGPCEVCFAGACSPALVGTNPKLATPGAGCSPQDACDFEGVCKPAVGQPCLAPLTASGFLETCASQACMADLCVSPVQETVPPDSAAPTSQVHEVLDGVVRDDGATCLLLREKLFADFPNRASSNGPFSYEYLRAGVRLACRTEDAWESRTLADFNAHAAGGGTMLDDGGTSLQGRFLHKLQLLSAPPGLVMLAHVGPEPEASTLRSTLGTQNCDLLATWFYGQLETGGRRCLVPTARASDGNAGSVRWYSARVVEGVHMEVLLAVNRGGTVDLMLHDCPNAHCNAGKLVSPDDVGTWPGVLVEEDGRPLVFHFPDAFDRVEAVDGVGTREAVVRPLCPLAQYRASGGLSGFDEDHPGRSLSALRVLRNGQPRWEITLLCGGHAATLLYDPALRAFETATLMNPDLGAVVNTLPFGLGDGQDGLVVAQRDRLLLTWKRPGQEGLSLQPLRDANSLALSMQGTWVGAPGGLPRIAWEEATVDRVEIPGQASNLWPSRSQVSVVLWRAVP